MMTKQDLFSKQSQLNARRDGSYWKKAAEIEQQKCVFCDLREKYVIYSNEWGTLTVNLFPYIDGQLLVIPKRHVENFVELEEKEMSGLYRLMRHGVKLLNNALNIDNIWVLLRDGNLAGKTVKHLHWNIMPYVDELNTWNYDKVELTIKPIDLASKLRKACGEGV